MDATTALGGPVRRTKNGGRSRRICFTLNNYTDVEVQSLKSNVSWKWICFGKEVGATGTPHLQGAIVFKNPMAFSTMHKISGLERAHFLPMYGHPRDNLDYCSKGDQSHEEWTQLKTSGPNYGKNADVFEYGEIPSEGKRTDITYAVERIHEGATMRELAQDPMTATVVAKYSKGLTLIRSLCVSPRNPENPPKVYWLWGKTGSGKTRCATGFSRRYRPEEEAWISHGGGELKWFDGYDGQRVVIIDDFRSKGCKFAFLLRLLDRYPLSVEFKGGFVNWNPEVIIITSPQCPQDMFSVRGAKIPEDLAQLTRRLTRVLEIGGAGCNYQLGIFIMLGQSIPIDQALDGYSIPLDFGRNNMNNTIDLTSDLDDPGYHSV